MYIKTCTSNGTTFKYSINNIILILFTTTFAKRKMQCNIAHRTQIRKFLTKKHFGCVSGNLDRLAFSLSLVRFHSHPVPLLRNSDKRTVNVMKVCIERNTLQPQLIRYTKMFTLFTFTFAKRRIQCNIAHRTHIRTQRVCF